MKPMEKCTPHYPLAEIQVQMTTVQAMNLTVSARTGEYFVVSFKEL